MVLKADVKMLRHTNKGSARSSVCCLSDWERPEVVASADDRDSRVWHNYHHKNTDGLPGLMLFMWGFGMTCQNSSNEVSAKSGLAGVPVGVYAIVQVCRQSLLENMRWNAELL
jgi:hypothetical protein